tara:strand:+ start:975 stop:1484 length:510 start_codon:yes stop_codon:yes gene_type:complete
MSNFSIIKKYLFLFLMLSIFIPSEILGMHHERELDKMKINNLYDDWYIAVETSDIQGYVDSLDENIVLIPPGGPVITGKENYRTFLGPVFDVASYEIDQKTPKNIKFYGDIATVEYNYVVYITFIGDAKSVPSEGALQDTVSDSIYFDVLKRQEDGSWKCLVHTWQQIN